MSDKVVVRFLKAWRGYSADELAGFDEAVADGLKSKGFAEAYEAGSESTRKPAKAQRAATGTKSGNPKGDGKSGTPGAPSDSPETQATTDGMVPSGSTDNMVGDDTDDEEKP
jgi:hypothetical protein